MLIFIVMIMLYTFMKSKKFLKCLCFSAVTGLGSLFFVYLIGVYTFPIVQINGLSLSISSALGIPGVIGLLMMNLM